MRIPGPYRKTPRIPKKKRYVREPPDTTAHLASPIMLLRGPRVIIVLVAMMAILGGSLVFKSKEPILSEQDKAQATCDNLSRLSRAITNFWTDCNRYPTTEEGLLALWQDPGVSNWHGPYVIDPPWPWSDYWDTPYTYSCNDGIVTLASSGPDGILGTDDDLVSPFFRPSHTSNIDQVFQRWRARQTNTTE